MHLHRSNRTEALVNRLVEVVSRPLADPLEPECIVVQGRGMERWLAMELAQKLGAWANPWFPFPRRLLELAFRRAMPEAEDDATAGFEPGRLAFAIAAVLADRVETPGYEPLARYVARGERAARLVDLSVRVAEAFDRYLVYRPDLIEGWDSGRDDGWESLLWREVTARLGREHPPARARRFLELARRGVLRLEGFPSRVCLFGISTLPPRYVELFAALARQIEVHLFMLSPSREFWADVRSRREQLR
ncbi:MAG: exodeoxyribonuclease V subunit gamma, partial [Candidatus Binatia bacterium]